MHLDVCENTDFYLSFYTYGMYIYIHTHTHAYMSTESSDIRICKALHCALIIHCKLYGVSAQDQDGLPAAPRQRTCHGHGKALPRPGLELKTHGFGDLGFRGDPETLVYLN